MTKSHSGHLPGLSRFTLSAIDDMATKRAYHTWLGYVLAAEDYANSLCGLRAGVQWSFYPLGQLLLATMEPSSKEESGYRTGFGAGPTGIESASGTC
jgi:hypothetical protein